MIIKIYQIDLVNFKQKIKYMKKMLKDYQKKEKNNQLRNKK